VGFFAAAIARKSGVSTLDLFREIYGGRVSSSGKPVNLQTALGVSTVFACARLIGNGMSQVPCKLMKETFDGKRTTRIVARDHPLYNLISHRPNPWQTGFEFRQMMSWHVEIAGNFFAFKNAPLGALRELIPFLPGEVVVRRNNDLTLTYIVTSAVTGKVMEFPAESIWHVRGPTWNGWIGIDWLQVARDAIGLAIATEESQAALHKNGVRTTGAYSFEGSLPEGQYDKLRAWIDREHAGAANAGRPMILDRAAKWVQTQMTAIDAQHIETRRYQVEDVCRSMGVLPIVLGFSDKSNTYASAEQMFLAHMVHTLSPRWQMYKASMNVNLLTEEELAAGYYFNFVEEGMIRGSVKDTKDAILGYVNGGLLTPNEGRDLLDRNPDSDPTSDELRLPVNISQPPDQTPGPADDPITPIP
jgi:HK97 family phage portal protein